MSLGPETYWQGLQDDYQAAYRQAFGRDPIRQACLLACAVAEHETSNSRAWPGTWNFGAVQLRTLTPEELVQYQGGALRAGDYTASRDGVLHIDTHPTPSGPQPYPVWFCAFPTRVAGIAFFLKTLWRLSAGAPDDPNATAASVAEAMYLHGYFEGAHPGARPVGQRKIPLTTPEQLNVNDYAGAVTKCAATIDGEWSNWTQDTIPPTEPEPHFDPGGQAA